MDRSKHIAIVGGSGFIGSRLARRLISSGHEVLLLDERRSEHYPKLWAHCNVCDPRSLVDALRDADTIYHLAAEHRDDVRPLSRYTQVNVDGTRNVCEAAAELGIDSIIFTSSVAIYGFPRNELIESAPARPFNEYGRTKWEAEQILREWANGEPSRTLAIVRPTVVFGEENRGNVYNLLRQIAAGIFVMVGNGENRKSMAYVENVAAFLEHCLSIDHGVQTYNYIDKPDLTMNELVALARTAMGKSDHPFLRIPYSCAYPIAALADLAASILGRTFPISRIRLRKFCANTRFGSVNIEQTGFVGPVSLRDGIARTVAHEFGGVPDLIDHFKSGH